MEFLDPHIHFLPFGCNSGLRVVRFGLDVGYSTDVSNRAMRRQESSLTSFIVRSLLGRTTLLLGRSVIGVVNLLFLSRSLARLALRCVLLAILSLLLGATFLGSSSDSAIWTSHELRLDLGPGIARRAVVGHAGESSKLFVVDLFTLEMIEEWGRDGGEMYFGRTGFERLHGPS